MEMIHNLPAAVAVVDRQMQYLAVSNKWLIDYGLGDQEITGKSHYEIFPDIPDRWKKIHQRALAGETLTAKEDQYQRENGDFYWLNWECRPWRKRDGTIGGIIMMSLDVTDQVQQRVNLANDSRLSAIGMMAGGIAHEINNPLEIINLATHLIEIEIQSESPDKTEILDKLNKIQATTERVAKIIRGLRILSRDPSRDPAHEVIVDEIINDVLSLCLTKFNIGQVWLEVKYHLDKGAKVWGRSAEIGQILLNLLNNSFDAVREQDERWIVLDITRQGRHIVFRVTDSGPGIPKAVQGKIMTPFFTTKPPGLGTGLGLSICRSIAEKNQGFFRLLPHEKNTTFEFAFLDADQLNSGVAA